MEGLPANGRIARRPPGGDGEQSVKDDSARDKAIEKLVADKLRARAGAPGAACPDAEILAAYVDRTLAPQERLRWEIHFAACTRCQEHVAGLVRLGEADQPAATPVASAVRGRRIFGLRWAWAAPMFVALVVAGLWYTGEFNQSLKQTTETRVQVPAPASAPAKEPEATEEGVKEKETPPASLQSENVESRKIEAGKNELRQKSVRGEQPAANARSTEAPSRPTSEMAVIVESAGAREDKGRQTPPPPSEPKPKPQGEPAATADKLSETSQGAIAPPSERARLAKEAAGEGGGVGSGTGAGVGTAAGGAVGGAFKSTPQTKDESLADRPKTPAPPAGAESKAVAVEAQALKSQSKNLAREQDAFGLHYATTAPRADRNLEMNPPAGSWRVGPHGLIQKADSKGNWETQANGVKADLFDIAFPDPNVGWAVGQAGTILRTKDGGKSWKKIPSPTREDLVRITATSNETAEITTRSGLVFSSTDGGKTWRASYSPQ